MARDYGERFSRVAEVLYEAFIREDPHQNPTWVELTPEVRRQWVCVAKEAMHVTIGKWVQG